MRSQGKRPGAKSSFTAVAPTKSVVIDGERVRAIRSCLHELANVLTGTMIATGLLAQRLNDEELKHYVEDIGEGGERGSALVCEIRGHLLAGEQAERLPGELLGEGLPSEI
jgi:hypothetical protein